MEFLRQWTLNIVYVSVLIAFVKTLVPEGKIRKTVLTASSLILLYTISAPVADLFSSNISDGFKFPDFAIDRSSNTTPADKAYFDMNNVTEIYKYKIEENVRSMLEGISDISKADVNVAVEENPKSQEYGFIRSVNIDIKPKNKKDAEQQIESYPTGLGKIIVEIDKKIDTGTKSNIEAKIINSEDINTGSELKIKIIKKVAALLEIDESTISVSFAL